MYIDFPIHAARERILFSPPRPATARGHRVPLGFSRVGNFYKIRPIFKGEQLLQNKGLIAGGNFYKNFEKIEENLPFFSKFSSDFSNFYKIRVDTGTKSNFYKISRNFLTLRLLQNKDRNEQLLPNPEPMLATTRRSQYTPKISKLQYDTALCEVDRQNWQLRRREK